MYCRGAVWGFSRSGNSLVKSSKQSDAHSISKTRIYCDFPLFYTILPILLTLQGPHTSPEGSIELTLKHVTSSTGINSTEFASFDHMFSDPLVMPIFGTMDSGMIKNVLLTQDVTASLNIIPLGFLDLLDTNVKLRWFLDGVDIDI